MHCLYICVLQFFVAGFVFVFLLAIYFTFCSYIFLQVCFPFYTGTSSILPAFYNLLKGPYNSCKVPFCCLAFYQMCPINQNCRIVRYRLSDIDFFVVKIARYR